MKAWRRSSFRALVIATVALAINATTLRAQQQGIPVTVTLKSNHRVEGYIDPVNGFSSMIIPVGMGASCYRIRNGLKRVYVSKYHMVNENPIPLSIDPIEFTIWQDAIEGKQPQGIMHHAYPFDEFGHRVINARTFKTGARSKNYVQGITRITPDYIELSSIKADGPKTSFKMSIANGAVPIDVVRKLLHNQISRSDNPVEYEEIFGYFLQAQQFDEALKELDLIERRFPERKEQVERNRKRVRQDRARQVVREIKTRVRNGQTNVARELAGAMNKDGVAQQVLLELQDILGGLDTNDSKVAEVRQKVTELVKRYRNDQAAKITPDQETMLGQFLAELETELSPTNVARLDSYLVQAADAAQKDQEKVALAISGWLRGSNNATPNFALAQSLFAIRELMREYLNSGDVVARQSILKELKGFESGNPRVIADMLAQMKPPEHENAVAGYTGEKPIEFTVTVPGTRARPGDQNFRVLVHLPIEYDPYKRYPLLITLPNAGSSVERQLDMFNDGFIEKVGRVGRASRAGVIVAAVDWTLPGQSTCGYTAREHATVLRAMRACFRKFQVDTDLVFLHGHGSGANLVYDIGLAHPEHFAGLIPVGGVIEKFAKLHAKNRGIPLSIYAIIGEGDVATQVANKETWDRWLMSSRFINLILVEYVGRLANENIPDSIEPMFEWMQFQRRRLPDRTGFDFSVKSMRPWDNYYWFLELNGFPRQNIMWPQTWEDGKLKPLALQGEMKTTNPNLNHFVVKPAKAGQSMTLWMSDDYVDFDKEVKITGRGRAFQDSVNPSVTVMLEDARTRCDRLHPFWARVDCKNGKWEPVE